MKYIPGRGAPSINTVANPGDIYIDIDTRNTYICREIISQSTNYISDVRTEYHWKRYIHFSEVATTGDYNDLINKPNPIKTINGISPDSNGNVEVDSGGVKTVNGNNPDSNGNVEINIPDAVTDEHINKLIIDAIPVSKYVYYNGEPDYSFDHSTDTPITTLRGSGTISNTTYMFAKINKEVIPASYFMNAKITKKNYSTGATSEGVVSSEDKFVYSNRGGAVIIDERVMLVETPGNHAFTYGSSSLTVNNCTAGMYFVISTFTYGSTTSVEKANAVYLAKHALENNTPILIMPSSTESSSKKFKITVDDTGTISATEVTE